jgi:surface antigen
MHIIRILRLGLAIIVFGAAAWFASLNVVAVTNPYSGGGCTQWAWARWHQLNSPPDLPNNLGNAKDWANNAPESLSVGSTARARSIAVFPPGTDFEATDYPRYTDMTGCGGHGCGHVAFVEAVYSNGTFRTSNYWSPSYTTPDYVTFYPDSRIKFIYAPVHPDTPTPIPNGRSVSDVDNNGKDDVIGAYQYRDENHDPTHWMGIWAFKSSGSGFSADKMFTSGSWSLAKTKFAVGDVNKDGKDDVIGVYDYGSPNIGVYVFKSDGADMNWARWSTLDYWDFSRSEFVAGDVNGDGYDDLVGIYDNGGSISLWVFKSTGSSFTVSKWYTSGGWDIKRSKFLVGDVDGDGRDDVIAVYDYGDNTIGIWAFKSTGSGFVAKKMYTCDFWTMAKSTFVAADVNGDNKDDVVGVYDTGSGFNMWIFKSTGTAMSASKVYKSGSWNLAKSAFVAGDMNGDNKNDVEGIYDYGGYIGIWVFKSTGAGFTASKTYTSGGWTFANSVFADPSGIHPGPVPMTPSPTPGPTATPSPTPTTGPTPTPNADFDGDGVPDETDNCAAVYNPGQEDSNNDGLGDACDPDFTDQDDDGIADNLDNCPFDYNPNQADADDDGLGDVCDPDVGDTDGDGILDAVDNCPLTVNPDQADIDGDGIGDACEEAGQAVGGIADLPDVAGGTVATSTARQGSSSPPYAAIAGAAAGSALLLAAGGWYARRRWRC